MGLPRLVGVLIAVAVLGSAAPVAADVAEAPAISPGDFWTYATNTSFAEGFYLDGAATFAVRSRGDVVVEGTPVDAFAIAVQGAGRIGGEIRIDQGAFRLSGAWDLVGENHLEAAGLKVVSSFLELRADGTADPFSQPFTLRVRNTTTYAILEDRWRFPVEVGDAGHLTARFNATEEVLFRYGLVGNTTRTNGTGERSIGFRAEATVLVDVPAGRFEAVRINETWADGRYDLLYYAPGVANNVRTESFEPSGRRAGATSLTSFRYQASEPPTFLGLTAVQWGLVATAIAGGLVGAVLLVRRRRRRQAADTAPR